MCSLTRLNQEEIESMNTAIISNEMESGKKKKKIPTNKSPGPYGFTSEFYQTFREELTCIFLRGKNAFKLIL